MQQRQVLDYISLAVIWGLSFLLVLKVVAAFGWIGAVTFRAFVARAILVGIVVATQRQLAVAVGGSSALLSPMPRFCGPDSAGRNVQPSGLCALLPPGGRVGATTAISVEFAATVNATDALKQAQFKGSRQG